MIAVSRGENPEFDGQECRLDITRSDHVNGLIDQGFRADVIVHLAGRVEIALEPSHPQSDTKCKPGQKVVEPLYSANVSGTANIVDLARTCGAGKIVFASSQAVYGFGDNGLADETTVPCPLEHYATSKVCAEQLLETASRQGISISILRFPGVFSPSRRDGAVSAMARSALENRLITINAEVEIPFDVLSLDDLVPGITKAIDHDGGDFELFNLSTGDPCSLELLAERIAALVPSTRIENHGVRQPSFQMSAERAERILGWRSAPMNQRLEEVLSVLHS